MLRSCSADLPKTTPEAEFVMRISGNRLNPMPRRISRQKNPLTGCTSARDLQELCRMVDGLCGGPGCLAS